MVHLTFNLTVAFNSFLQSFTIFFLNLLLLVFYMDDHALPNAINQCSLAKRDCSKWVFFISWCSNLGDDSSSPHRRYRCIFTGNTPNATIYGGVTRTSWCFLLKQCRQSGLRAFLLNLMWKWTCYHSWMLMDSYRLSREASFVRRRMP